MTTYTITREHLREAINNPAPYQIQALTQSVEGHACHYTHPSIPNCHCVVGVAMLKAGVPADHPVMLFEMRVHRISDEFPDIQFEDMELASNLQQAHDGAVRAAWQRKGLIERLNKRVNQ